MLLGEEPFIYKIGNLKKVIKGVDEAIRGMRFVDFIPFMLMNAS